MALINCPECGRQVSDKAAACPNCACPITAAPTASTPLPAPPRHDQVRPRLPVSTPATVSSPEFRTRAQPGVWGVIISLIGVVILFAGSWFLGLALIAVAVVDYLASFVEIGPTAVRVKRGLLNPTTEIQLSKIETVQVGFGIGGWKAVTVKGTGGTAVALGSLFNADVVYEHLQAALAARR